MKLWLFGIDRFNRFRCASDVRRLRNPVRDQNFEVERTEPEDWRKEGVVRQDMVRRGKEAEESGSIFGVSRRSVVQVKSRGPEWCGSTSDRG